MPRGPVVNDAEDVYRVINVSEWWVAAEHRVSSAAFSFPLFSVDVVSRTTIEKTMGRVTDARGLVRFNVGAAKAHGCSTHDEPDPDFPDNPAHAHVYLDYSNSQRKKRAQRLVGIAVIEVSPLF